MGDSVGGYRLAVALASVSRYRGFPLATYAIPAFAFLALQLRHGRLLGPVVDGREERLLSLLFVAAAFYIAWFEGPLNWQALSFCGLLLLLALNTVTAWRWPEARLSVVPAA